MPTKRGAHLALSLERLAARCDTAAAAHRPVRHAAAARRSRALPGRRRTVGSRQSTASPVGRRHGRAVAQSPLGHGSVATTPHGAESTDEFAAHHGAVRYRPVTIVDAGAKKALKLTHRSAGRGHGAPDDSAGRQSAERARRRSATRGPSIWSAIHPRLLELIRAHRSTLIFVNSRRLAERLAGALNELAGETLVRSHHGSIARAQRVEIEDLLKAGALRALVATSSLELGIDMGAIDLVVQIEAPPSVASGLQRIGRGGHQVDAVSEGVIFPKFRGDLVACAAVAKAMHDGAVEATRYPRNPLDIVGAADRRDDVDGRRGTSTICSRRCARAAPFAELEPRPCSTACSTCCRAAIRPTSSPSCGRASPGTASPARSSAREGAKRVAIANGGTIPDRGLYGVFLAGAGPGRRARRRARRRDGVREPRRRDVRARRLVVAHRGDHARPRARVAGARASRARCRSGKATAPAGRSSSGSRSAG